MDDEFYMREALKLARQAFKSGEFPVGCVIASQEGVVAKGLRKNSYGKASNEVDHAELIALRQLADRNYHGNPRGLSIYITMEPCLMCLGAIILSNIGRVVYGFEDVMGGATACDLNRLGALYINNLPAIVPYVLRSQCAKLFKDFFSNPQNLYWQGSRLAEYTLAQ